MRRNRRVKKTKRFAGVAFLKVGRHMMALRGNFIASPSRVKRITRNGYTELPRVPYIEGDVVGSKKKLPAKINDATVFAELCDGKTFVLQHCDTIRSKMKKRKLRVRFEGMTCEEIA